MPDKQEFKMVNLRREIYDILVKDKHHFEKEVGGTWSFSDVIQEYIKIFNSP